MSKHIKTNFKFWVNVFTFIALAFLIILTWDQIKEAFGNLATLNPWVLGLMLPLQLINYYAIAKLYKEFFDAQGSKVKLKEMYKVALELNFVNHVFPSGGVSGFSYLSIRLRSMGIPTSKSTLAQIVRFALTFISFIILLLFGLALLSLGSSTSPFVVLVASTIIFSTIAGSGVGIFIISKPSRIKAFVSWLPNAINKVSKVLRNNKEFISMKRVENTLEDLHKDYKMLSKDFGLIKRLLWWALFINITEVATIYLVYIAFGSMINPGALIIAYAVANFAGLVAILPGGVGIYEGLMTAVLAGAGVNKVLALSATVVYRVLTMAVFLPIGYLFYSRAITKGVRSKLRKGEDASKTDA